MTTNDGDGLEPDPPTKFENGDFEGDDFDDGDFEGGVFNGESGSTAGSSDSQQLATVPSSQSNVSSEAQELADLQAEVRSVIEPFRKPNKKPPFTLAEIVVICLIIVGELEKEAIHFWMVNKFHYYGLKALAFHTKLGGAPAGWGPTEEIFVQFEKIFSELDPPIHRKIDGEKLPEDDPVKFPSSDDSKWAVNSPSAARGYLHRHLRASSSQHFRFMDLPTELRVDIYKLTLLLPRSGVNVNTGPYVEPTLSTFSKDYEQPFPGLISWPRRSTTVWQLPRVSIKCPPPATHLALLQVSKTIYEEAMPVFYGDNLFVCENIGRLRDFLKRTPETRRKNIRHLAFSIEVGFKADLPKVARMLAALPYLKELDIWIDEEHFNGEKVSTAGLPGYRISGFTALRSIPSLKALRLHGNCGNIQKALAKLMEEAKAKAKAKEKEAKEKAKEKEEKEKANKKPRAPRKRKAIASAEENDKAPRKRKLIASAEANGVEPGMSLQSGVASGLVSVEGGPSRLAVSMPLQGDPWGLNGIISVQDGPMGLGGIAPVQGGPKGLSGTVSFHGDTKGLGESTPVEPVPRGALGFMSVETHLGVLGEFIPVPYGLGGLNGHSPVKYDLAELGEYIPIDGQGEGDGRWPVFTPWWG